MAVDDAYTKLLLHMDGANNGSVFVDEAGHTVTLVGGAGSAITTTSQSKFGGSSASLGAGYLSIVSPDLYVGTGKFTFDLWVRFLSTDTVGQFFSYGGSNSGLLLHHQDNKIHLYAGGFRISTTAATYVHDIWYHVALVGNGAVNGSRNIKMYVNGTLAGTWTTDYNLNKNVIIAANEADTGERCYGYYDEVRVSIGIERWTANFTPPTTAYGPVGYKASGSVIFGPILLPEMTEDPQASSIGWTSETPTDTSITVETAISNVAPSEGDFIAVNNAGSIPELDVNASGKNLYIKVELSTMDTSKTPRLLSLGYSILAGSDEAKIVIKLVTSDRLKYPIGNVDVAYNTAQGNLVGLGNVQVASFLQSLVPNITPLVFNPHDVERITAAISAEDVLTQIYYVAAQEGNEAISATLTTENILYFVNNIPT